MYCSNCGIKNDENNYCVNCGNKLNNNNVIVNKESNGLKTASIVLGILGIIGTVLIVFSPISFVLSLIGLILGIVANKKIRNVSGIILNSIGLFFSIIILGIIWLILMFMFGNSFDEISDYRDNYVFDREYYEKFQNIIEEY